VATAAALGVYGFVLGLVGAIVWRRPVAILPVFVVGLAAHNAVAAALFGLGVRGHALTAVQAWKEILFGVVAVRLVLDAWRARRLPFRPAPADWLALAFAVVVVAYALAPQAALDGLADRHARAYALRHDLVPVLAYFLGRCLLVDRAALKRLGWTLVGAAGAVAALGLIEVYGVSIDWWRASSVPSYFHDQLGYDYHGTGGLPENFVFNTGSEDHFLRRVVSVFLSPLATAYMLVVALLFAFAGGPLLRRPRLLVALGAVCAAGLLFTFTRAAILGLVAGLVILAVARRRLWPVGAAVVALAAGVAFAEVFPSLASRGSWTEADLVFQREQAVLHPGASGGTTDPSESSIRSHLTSVRAGLETVARHPQGFGLGNAGTVASREDVEVKAGESNYTELGVETGVAGMLLFAAWNLALLGSLLAAARRAVDDTERWAAAAVASSLAAVLALAVQTDTLGDPWLAYCIWALGGAVVTATARAAVRSPRAVPAVAPSRP
jgi:hypothetical protein